MKKTLLSMALCLVFGASAMAQITYDLGGGKILPASNEELYALLQSYYPTFSGKARSHQPITAAATFFSTGTQKTLTDATSEYKWLGDYILTVAPTLNTNPEMTETNWRFTLTGLLNLYQEYVYGAEGRLQHYACIGDWTEAGKPVAWQAACADVVFTLPASTEQLGAGLDGNGNPYTWAFLLPSAVKEGFVFKGWKDADGNVVTEVPAGAATGTYSIVWEAVGGTTALENVAAEENVTKVIENGQLIIIRDGVRYNALGAIVK